MKKPKSEKTEKEEQKARIISAANIPPPVDNSGYFLSRKSVQLQNAKQKAKEKMLF